MCAVEKMKRLAELVRSPKGIVWVMAYVLILGLKPCVQDIIQKAVALAPLDLVVAGLALAVVVVLWLPAKKRAEFKDIWEGGKGRADARESIAALKKAIDECPACDREVVQAARMAFCMAMLSFQSGDYEEAIRTANAAQQALNTPAQKKIAA